MFVPEHEILACLKTHLKSAASDCADLAVVPGRGPVYKRFRDTLKLIEGCCRQMAHYREDCRWLPLGMQIEEAHKRSLKWLRSYVRSDQHNDAHPLFLRLAEHLRTFLKLVEDLETKATGRLGLILPRPLPGATRTEGRMMQVKTPGGLLLPPGYSAAA